MPKVEEYAEVVINGQRFREWESVHVSTDFKKVVRVFQVAITERSDSISTQFSSLRQVKTGDKCAVYLAGKKVAEAFVYQRQVSYNRNAHAIQIVGRSMTGDLVDSSAPMKTSHWRNYPFQPIAEKLLQPFGIKLRLTNPPASLSKKFKDVSFIPGESVFSVIDRLARMRGMFVTDNENGDLVVGRAPGGMQGDIVEGRNILEANFLVQDDRYSNLSVFGQQRGDDQDNMDKSRQPSAVVQGDGAMRHRPIIVAAEEPGDAVDMKHRAEHEANHYLDQKVEVMAKVFGWLSPSGDLWEAGKEVMVVSPMMPINQKLAIESCDFHQDNSGTTTTLKLVMPNRLGQFERPSATVDPNAGDIPGGRPAEATPQE